MPWCRTFCHYVIPWNTATSVEQLVRLTSLLSFACVVLVHKSRVHEEPAAK